MYETLFFKCHFVLFQHSTDPKYECKICGYRSTPRYLNRHMSIHQLPELDCPICGKKLKNEKTLADHIRTHDDEPSFRCAECPYACKTLATFQTHMRIAHRGGKKRDRRPKDENIAIENKVFLENRPHTKAISSVANCEKMSEDLTSQSQSYMPVPAMILSEQFKTQESPTAEPDSQPTVAMENQQVIASMQPAIAGKCHEQNWSEANL